ncbi:hypothetical protein ACLESO_43935, partial [Pyxidicoccus sp. 3LG]
MIFWDVVERHLEEADFLWGLWEHSLVAAGLTLADVAEGPEERLLAHLDGLVANGPEVVHRLLNPALKSPEPQRVSAAASALLQTPGEAGVETVMTALYTLPGQRAPLARALACASRPDLLERVRGLLRAQDKGVATAAAEVLVFHHAPLEAALPDLLESGDPAARALGLRALPDESAAPRYAMALRTGLVDQDDRVVTAAMEAGCVLGDGAAWQCARDRAVAGDRGAMLLLALGGGDSEHRELMALLADPARRAAALWALGFTGTPEAVDASLELLGDKQVGHLAGEVLTAVAGVSLAEAGLAMGATETEALDHVAEDELPRPAPEKVRRWWLEHRGRFAKGQRYLMGQPRSLPGLLAALAE